MKIPEPRIWPLFLLLSSAAMVSAQGPARSEPVVEIQSPEADSYVSGRMTLRAYINPPSSVSRVTFSVDGREVCTIDLPPFECGWHAGTEVKERLIRLVAYLAGGGRTIRTLRTKGIEFTQNVDVDVVQVTVTVTDNQGGFISGLPRSAFKVFEDGKPQNITHFASEDVPLELIVAVDISGSMSPTMPKLKEAVKVFLGAVPSRDEVTLLGFNDTVFPVIRKTTDPSERVRAVDRLASWGATVLYDVIIRAIDMLGLQAGRKALIVFTDGEDQGSHVTLEQVEARLQASDVTLYMIGQGRGVSVDRLKRVMQRLTEPTGGRVLSTNSIEELSGAFDELLEELSHQYLLGYPPLADTRDGKWHEIKVQVDGYRNVRARQGYRFATSKP
jgi:Ca-activated chloride channel family protein